MLCKETDRRKEVKQKWLCDIFDHSDLLRRLINRLNHPLFADRLMGWWCYAYLQSSMFFGRDSRRLPETLRTLSLERHPMEFGRDLSWFECASSTTKFSSLAITDSGMLCLRILHEPCK